MGRPEARRSLGPGLTDLSAHGVRNRPEEGTRHRAMARPATGGQPPIRCPDLGDGFPRLKRVSQVRILPGARPLISTFSVRRQDLTRLLTVVYACATPDGYSRVHRSRVRIRRPRPVPRRVLFVWVPVRPRYESLPTPRTGWLRSGRTVAAPQMTWSARPSTRCTGPGWPKHLAGSAPSIVRSISGSQRSGSVLLRLTQLGTRSDRAAPTRRRHPGRSR